MVPVSRQYYQDEISHRPLLESHLLLLETPLSTICALFVESEHKIEGRQDDQNSSPRQDLADGVFDAW